MDYEKAYKKLVKNFKAVLNLNSIKQNGAVPVEDIVKMIPELKETEDNSIKEELIKFLNNYINAHGCTEMSKWVSWIEKQEQSDLVSFINHERDKKGFYHCGKEVSWNEMPLDVRKHDYPYYFEDDVDCFPFNVGKQDEQKNLLNFDEAEKEKNDFVSGQFIECRKSFNEFKELESYWFEYVGDDTYTGRSDNILNQKFHITPRQLFTLFTHEHCKKYYENQAEQKAPIDIDKMVADYKNNPEKNNESFGKPINCMIRAYRQGLNDAIGKIVNSKQSCWKPTEEQMRDFGLLLDYNIGVFDYKKYMTVYSLYEDLKKITEE